MILERTLHMLQARTETMAQADEIGQMGFIQWLGWLDGRRSFDAQAAEALSAAAPFRGSDPAVAVFCDLIDEARLMPPRPLALAMPKSKRRGGAKKRRQRI